jgi:hypothetical protein
MRTGSDEPFPRQKPVAQTARCRPSTDRIAATDGRKLSRKQPRPLETRAGVFCCALVVYERRRDLLADGDTRGIIKPREACRTLYPSTAQPRVSSVAASDRTASFAITFLPRRKSRDLNGLAGIDASSVSRRLARATNRYTSAVLEQIARVTKLVRGWVYFRGDKLSATSEVNSPEQDRVAHIHCVSAVGGRS